ncbi:MAG: bifunctional 4'-phosphopantothenoylcysteine decarboxylase/phosphopantothenoylcysteine synthetase, partial [Chloroflexi bacterium]|nr:bifunctional 4'-phosphopantothenoylcysteine decarboxylase/phosphopantothenoylcysteine synthetase [Chloroflexota bacterium]
VVKVGFAAESQNLLENARKKLFSKGLALIAANDITATDSGFATDANKVTILDREGDCEELPLMSKYEVGHRILDRVAALLNGKS